MANLILIIYASVPIGYFGYKLYHHIFISVDNTPYTQEDDFFNCAVVFWPVAIIAAIILVPLMAAWGALERYRERRIAKSSGRRSLDA